MKLSPGHANAPAARVPPRQEVTFADGSACWLLHNGAGDALYERSVAFSGGGCLRVDLRDLAPDLADQLPGSSPRAACTAIFRSLRARFASAGQMAERIGAQA